MLLEGLKVGIGFTGSFCTFDKVFPEIKKIIQEGAEVLPIMSTNASTYDTRFGKAEDFKNTLKEITGKEVIDNIVDAEPIGPNNLIDIMVIAPCTVNNI